MHKQVDDTLRLRCQMGRPNTAVRHPVAAVASAGLMQQGRECHTAETESGLIQKMSAIKNP